jgi:DNA-binding NarL/FixJ family response regulator
VKEPKFRVLVVDDFEPWCRFVSSTLGKRRELQIVGEASDGLAAVKKAQELQPDLILLDIGLPTINGIEAARQIRELAPKSKILFATENHSWAIAQEALSTGAYGFLVKSDAARELMPAVEAVLQDKLFVSRRLAGYASAQASNSPSVRERQHVVQFYAHDSQLLDNLFTLFKKTLSAGESGVAVMTNAHRMSLEARLNMQGVDTSEATKKGRFVLLDAEETLGEFMDADGPNRDRFVERVGRVIRMAENAALAKNKPVVVFGEMVAVLWAQGKYQAAIRLEELWNELILAHSFYLCCAYPASGFAGQLSDESQATVRACHSHVVSTF